MHIHQTHRLERSACPSHFEGSGAHLVIARHHGRREQEGILRSDAAQIAGQIDLIGPLYPSRCSFRTFSSSSTSPISTQAGQAFCDFSTQERS